MMMTVGDVVILIAALAAAVVSIIDAVRVNKKLDVIHKDTNGNLSDVKRELIDVKQEFRRQRGAQ